MTNKRINIAELEYLGIRENLKEFLRGQDQFKDYDFEGSNLAILLDLLAYNTHYNAMYMNMALNEAFLDSASRRSSVVSHATALGYMPRSFRAARTIIEFAVKNTLTPQFAGSYLTLPKYSLFSGVKDGIRYSFYTKEDISSLYNPGTQAYEFTNVEVLEGSPLKQAFIYNQKNAFRLENTNVDTSTLVVRVQKSPSSTNFENFHLASNYSSLDGSSPVYFIREIDGFYEISFGDGLLGKQLSNGNVINVEYFVCSGESPNGIRLLQYDGSYLGGTVVGLSLQYAVSGGRDQEDIEQIRFNAPNVYAAQNRIVTAQDYQSLILSKVPAIEDVSVWGGENNNPPVYGKVFISPKTVTGRTLTYNEQQTIINTVLEDYKLISIIPEFVNPEYLEVLLDLVVYYDQTITNKTPDQLKSDIIAELIKYDNNELQRFNRILRSSAISRLCEGIDQSILSSAIRSKIRRKFTPLYNLNSNYNINIGNPLFSGTIQSTGFYISGKSNVYYFADDGKGNIETYYLNNGIKTDAKISGSVNYETGLITLTDLNINRLADSFLYIFATPNTPDIVSVANQIVLIDFDSLKVNVVADESTKGRVYSGNKFKFSNITV